MLMWDAKCNLFKLISLPCLLYLIDVNLETDPNCLGISFSCWTLDKPHLDCPQVIYPDFDNA